MISDSEQTIIVQVKLYYEKGVFYDESNIENLYIQAICNKLFTQC